MRFFPKSSIIDAVQYNGSNDAEIADFVDSNKNLRPAAWRNADNQFCVHTSNNNDVVLAPGLWVMREAGKIAVVHPNVMDGYLPVPN